MKRGGALATFLCLFILWSGGQLFAHCDTMDGPLVKDAIQALEKNNLNYVLKWVDEKSEPEITQAFQRVIKVRKLNNDAKEVADRYFFDTIVRIHRNGEGMSFTGVKPRGTPIDEKIAAADKAIETGNLSLLEKEVEKAKVSELKERFAQVMKLKKFDVNNVKAGREYIEAYVRFFKFAEGEDEHAEHHH